MKKWIPALIWRLLSLLILTVLGGLLSATLVRYSAGYGVDERELDPRLNASSVEAIRNEHRHHANVIRYYGQYLMAAAHGSLGTSQSLQRPIAELLKERFPITMRSVLIGVSVAWAAALSLGIWGVVTRGSFFEISSTFLTGFLLSLPSAVIALLFVYLRAPVFLAIGLVTFPKLFRFIRNILLNAREQPHVLAARARGIRQLEVVLRHVLCPAVPALLALLGVSISLGFGAAVPIEALCDSAGIGQLAWFAAINRDLPLIMNLTLLVTLITVSSNSIAEYAAKIISRPA